MKRQGLLALAVSLLLPLGGYGEDLAPTLPVRIESASGVHPLVVEIAATPERRARGLMGRETLAPGTGMLFLYDQPQPGNAGFWMYNTRIPLDIAFLDADGRIRALRTMEPCPETVKMRCPSYFPHVSYTAALEVNGGYFAAHEVYPGDHVVFESPVADALREDAR